MYHSEYQILLCSTVQQEGGHIRTVPIPLWVKGAIDSWTESAQITTGRVFRSINKAGKIWEDGMTPEIYKVTAVKILRRQSSKIGEVFVGKGSKFPI